ncbi:MAG: T9SS type A sorting domain-containing protein [Bacteroidia bacterium]|jgi:hypothetical protein|nr:T9SS type A sorting domain-containing protein [Bacteroidia bacterium]
MKTKLLLIAMLLSGVSQAQYFHDENGTGRFEQTYDGTNILIGGQGHLVAATTQVLGGEDLMLTRTDVNGQLGIGTFNNIYQMFDAAGNLLNAQPCKILQIANGTVFVVGSYYSFNGVVPPGIFTAILNPATGVAINVRGWQTFAPALSGTISATSACRALAPNSNIVHITGFTDATVPGNGVRPLVMTINGATNGLVWARIYDFLPTGAVAKVIPYDIVASPYQPNPGIAELMIVGTYYDGSGADEGFVYRVNTANGNPSGGVTTYDSGRTDQFNAVTVASGGGGGGNGFVITGYTDVPGIWQTTTVKVDPTGTVLRWSTMHDYSISGDNFGEDVIQRLNTFGQWNYYTAGFVANGVQGANDFVVYFVDDAGNALREFTYGTTDNERAVEISNFVNTASDGITVYGNIGTANDPGNEYFVKAYYNGVSGCRESFNQPNTQVYNINSTIWPNTRAGTFSFSTFTLPIITNPNLVQPCFNMQIAGGNNLRQAENAEEQTSSVSVFPNPLSLINPLLSLSLTSPAEQQIEIRITDMLGREILNQQILVTQGQSLQQIQLPKGVTAGVYSIHITGEGLTENHRFVIQ